MCWNKLSAAELIQPFRGHCRCWKELGLASWPGVLTASECFAALKAGADGLKIFPCSVIGPAGLKAMRAVLPS